MRFNGPNWLLTVMIFTSLTISCSKDEQPTVNPNDETKVEICITADFNDFGTKSDIKNIFRVTWSAGTADPVVYDSVYVYGIASGASVFSCLGKLGAKPVEGTGNKVANLKGKIIAPNSNLKITLVYSPVLTAAPFIIDDAISIDLTNQEGTEDNVAFVAYSSVDYKKTTEAECFTSFNFATSVISVNVSGMDVNQTLSKACIDSIETVCQLTLNATEAPAVSGTSRDVIVRNFPETVLTNDKGMVAFYMAVPVFTADDRRGLRVSEKGKHTYRFSKFTTQSNSDGGRIINSIVAIPKPIKYVETKGLTTIDYGYGTFVPETGVFWAPVDCGYDKNDYKCGKLYQFGRMDGCGYYRDASATNPPQDAPNKIIQSLVTVIAPYYTSSPAYDKFYGKPSEDTFDWYTSDKYEQMLVWPVEKSENMRIGNPCPDGWRVPTCDELSSLIGGASKSGIGGFQTDERGSSPLKGLRGLFFDGTAEKHPTSGVFLTAAGYRHRDDGSFLRRGMTGNYWSSSPSSTNPIFAGYLNFNENEAYIVSDGTRANGYSVRCVQE